MCIWIFNFAYVRRLHRMRRLLTTWRLRKQREEERAFNIARGTPVASREWIANETRLKREESGCDLRSWITFVDRSPRDETRRREKRGDGGDSTKEHRGDFFSCIRLLVLRNWNPCVHMRFRPATIFTSHRRATSFASDSVNVKKHVLYLFSVTH